ncbi:MAG: hypothetical protein ACOCWQ_03295 [Nanoarchaeota archaeon]
MRTYRQLLRKIRQEIRSSGLLPQEGIIAIQDDGSSLAQILEATARDAVTNPHVEVIRAPENKSRFALFMVPASAEDFANSFLNGILRAEQAQQNQENLIYPLANLRNEEIAVLAQHHGIEFDFCDPLGLLEEMEEFAPGTTHAAAKSARTLRNMKKGN